MDIYLSVVVTARIIDVHIMTDKCSYKIDEVLNNFFLQSKSNFTILKFLILKIIAIHFQ